jgi:hypothetical protein
MATNAQIVQALINLTPTAQWNLIGDDYATIDWLSPEITQPTEQQVNDQIIIDEQQAPLNACKRQASQLLYETDWTTIADVADPTKSQPYLLNPQDFVTYRSAVRQLAVYPVANPTWPIKPTSQWSSI